MGHLVRPYTNHPPQLNNRIARRLKTLLQQTLQRQTLRQNCSMNSRAIHRNDANLPIAIAAVGTCHFCQMSVRSLLWDDDNDDCDKRSIPWDDISDTKLIFAFSFACRGAFRSCSCKSRNNSCNNCHIYHLYGGKHAYVTAANAAAIKCTVKLTTKCPVGRI